MLAARRALGLVARQSSREASTFNLPRISLCAILREKCQVRRVLSQGCAIFAELLAPAPFAGLLLLMGTTRECPSLSQLPLTTGAQKWEY